ncbi:MAG: hypothetical protein EXR77_13910 [Myxococcales bacterium]|nr:hypothetical protein [Myxococcales bacterium]
MSFQLHRNGQYLPCDLNKLRDMARKGDLAQDEYVYDERVRTWVGAAQIDEMKDAWNIGENEATVAMELSPEMLAMFDQQDGAAKVVQAASAAAKAPEPQRQSAPVPRAPEPAPRLPEPAPRLPEPAPRAPESRPPQQDAPPPRSDPPRPEPARSFGGGGGGGGGRKSNRAHGSVEDPVLTTAKNVICFIFAILWVMKRYDEVNAFFGEKRLTWWFLLIPILNLITMWKFFKSVNEMAQLVGANVPDRAVVYLVGQFCTGGILTFYLMQTDLNAIWEHMGAKKT